MSKNKALFITILVMAMLTLIILGLFLLKVFIWKIFVAIFALAGIGYVSTIFYSWIANDEEEPLECVNLTAGAHSAE